LAAGRRPPVAKPRRLREQPHVESLTTTASRAWPCAFALASSATARKLLSSYNVLAGAPLRDVLNTVLDKETLR
jgi:hypothetical protein